jgi:hypothetical protein
LLTQSQKFIGCIKGGPVPQFDTSDDLEEVAKLTGSSTHLMTSKKQRSSLPSGFARQFDTSDDLEEAAKLTSIRLRQAGRYIR